MFVRSYIFALMIICIFMSSDLAVTQDRGISVSTAQSKEKRLALVIGNGTYETGPLKNAVNDAQDMAQALRELGFEVLYKENVTQNDMKRAIRAFGDKLRGGGVGLFYYAGHGAQVKGENYLIPVGAQINNEEDIEYESVDAGFILAQMEAAGNAMNIVILDACRNNPFARSFRSVSRGLAMMDAPSGTLIAYATAPGSVASDGNERNGIYTQELLSHMKTPGLSVEELFKQVRVSVRTKTEGAQTPWESSSLTGDFYFLTDGQKVSAPPAVSQVPNAAAIELSYWDTIKDSSDPEDFRLYLKNYPNGRFSDIAKRKIADSAGRTVSPAKTDDTIRRTTSQLTRDNPQTNNYSRGMRIAYPSASYVTEQTNLFSATIPSNWRALEGDQNMISYAPEGAYGPQGITHGVMFAAVRSNHSDVQSAVRDVVQGLLQSNSYLTQATGYQRTTVDGREALATTLSGRSPIKGNMERVTIVAVLLSGGQVFYMAAVSPQDEYTNYQRAFNDILRSLKLNGK
jgi:uncharacterized caspase-like protein